MSVRWPVCVAYVCDVRVRTVSRESSAQRAVCVLCFILALCVLLFSVASFSGFCFALPFTLYLNQRALSRE